MDPYRAGDVYPSANWWHTQVGEDAAFTPHSVTEDPPLTTWLELLTLDYVLSNFLMGSCEVLGVSEGTTRIDAPIEQMDHRALLCQLWVE